MSFGEAISSFWSNYTNFKGRARRSEYWFAYLFYILVYFGAVIVDAVIGTALIVTALWVLATFIPFLAVAIRRLHDIGRSGWFLLMGLIPFAGAIVLLIFFVEDSQKGDNAYGPSPKEASFQ